MTVSDFRLRLRWLAWSAPVLAAWQSGCTHLRGSCEGFEPMRITQTVPFEVNDSGLSDAGPPATSEQCVEFCSAHGSWGANIACHTATADGGLVVVCEFNTVCEGRRPTGYQPPCDDASAALIGCYFARMAAGEAASVIAFQQMAEECAP